MDKDYFNQDGISYTVLGDTLKARGLCPLAKKLMYLTKMNNVNNLYLVENYRFLPDGSKIHVRSHFGHDTATILAPPFVTGGEVEKWRIIPKEERLVEYVPWIRHDTGMILCSGGGFSFNGPYKLYAPYGEALHSWFYAPYELDDEIIEWQTNISWKVGTEDIVHSPVHELSLPMVKIDELKWADNRSWDPLYWEYYVDYDIYAKPYEIKFIREKTKITDINDVDTDYYMWELNLVYVKTYHQEKVYQYKLGVYDRGSDSLINTLVEGSYSLTNDGVDSTYPPVESWNVKNIIIDDIECVTAAIDQDNPSEWAIIYKKFTENYSKVNLDETSTFNTQICFKRAGGQEIVICEAGERTKNMLASLELDYTTGNGYCKLYPVGNDVVYLFAVRFKEPSIYGLPTRHIFGSSTDIDTCTVTELTDGVEIDNETLEVDATAGFGILKKTIKQKYTIKEKVYE